MQKLKHRLGAMLSAMLLLSATACADSKIQMADTYIVCDSIQNLENTAGFSANFPTTINGYSTRVLSISRDHPVIQALYLEDDTTSAGGICIRKAFDATETGCDNETYSNESTIQMDGFEAKIKGTGDTVNLATWSKAEFSYFISSTKPLSKAAIVSLITQIGNE